MSSIIILLGLLNLAVLNIFVYRRISRNEEIYARWYLEDLPAVSYYVDKLVNEKKMSKIDAAIQKNKCMKRINRNLSLAKYFDYLAWILMALIALALITLSILNHCLFFSTVFIYFEIIIAILIIVSYISTVLALHRLGLKVIKEKNKEFKKFETITQNDFYTVFVDDLSIELGIKLVENKDRLNKLIETVPLIREEILELPKIRICDNSSLGTFDYKLKCKGEEIINRSFIDGLTEENIEQIKMDIIMVYNEKLKNNE